MSNAFESSIWNDASACSPPRKVFPFTGDNTTFYFEQDYQQKIEKWTPGVLNSAHPTFLSFILVEETPVEHIGGGMGRWTRVYAPIFNARNDYEQYTYTYPALENAPVPRNSFSFQVPSRLAYKYFLIGSSLRDITPFTKVQTPSDIPVYLPSIVIYPGFDWLQIIPGALEVLTEAQYIARATAAQGTNKYSETNPTGEQWEIVAEVSTYRRWKGNIFERITRYVPAY